MNNNTHTEFITLGDGIRAFITGIRDKCDHRWNDSVLYTVSGKTITWSTYPEWASYTSGFRERLIYDRHTRNGDQIIGGAAACSKCGKEYSPNLFDDEI